jgi:hypothetical protein
MRLILFIQLCAIFLVLSGQAEARDLGLGKADLIIKDFPLIEVGKPFNLVITTKAATDKVEVDSVSAWMPEHSHGLVRLAEVVATSANAKTIRGILLQMGGAWLFAFRVHAADSWFSVRLGIHCVGTVCQIADQRVETLAF